MIRHIIWSFTFALMSSRQAAAAYKCSTGSPSLERYERMGIGCSVLESFMGSVYCERGHVCPTLGRRRADCGAGESSVLQCRKDAAAAACPASFACDARVGGDPNLGFCCPAKAECPGGRAAGKACASALDCPLDEECVSAAPGAPGVCCALHGPRCGDGSAAVQPCSAQGRCPDPFRCSGQGLCCLPGPSRRDAEDERCGAEGPYHAFGPCQASSRARCGPTQATYSRCLAGTAGDSAVCCAVLCPGGELPAQPVFGTFCDPSQPSSCPTGTACSNKLCCPAFQGHQCSSDSDIRSTEKCTFDSDCDLGLDCERSASGVGFCCPAKAAHVCSVKGEAGVERCSADFECGLGEYCEEGFCCASPDPVCSSGAASSQPCNDKGLCPSGFVCEQRGSVESPDGVCCASTCPDQSSPKGFCRGAAGNSLTGSERYSLRCSGRQSCFVDGGANPLCCPLKLCPEGRVAQLSCDADADCPLDSDCQPTGLGYGICCPTDYTCPDGSTGKDRCATDVDCPLESTCRKNPMGQGICCAFQQQCPDGSQSNLRCKRDSECSHGFDCQSGACCAAKKLCSDGSESGGVCSGSGQCGRGRSCQSGECCPLGREEGDGSSLCPRGFRKSVHPRPSPQPIPGAVPIQCASAYDCYQTLDGAGRLLWPALPDRACVGPDPAWRINFCCYRPADLPTTTTQRTSPSGEDGAGSDIEHK